MLSCKRREKLGETMSAAPDGKVSFFRSHYIIIFCIGIVFFTSPQWIKALLEWKFEWDYLYEWAAKIGEAAIIGVVVGYFLDRILLKSLVSAVDGRAREIGLTVSDNYGKIIGLIEGNVLAIDKRITETKKDVFFGALGITIERDVLSVFRKTIVECPVYRDPMRMQITLTLEKHRHDGGDIDVLRCDWYEEYSIWGLRSPTTIYDFEVSLSTDDIPAMEHKVGITRMSIDGKVFQGGSGSPFVGTKADGFSRFSQRLEIPQGKPIKIESYSTSYKTLTDSDSFEMGSSTPQVERVRPSKSSMGALMR